MPLEHELEIKLVVVGDGAVGKTSLLMSYSANSFPVAYVPTVFDNYSTDVLVDGRCVRLSLWDTAGQEDYDRLRPLSYSGTDIFLLCFSLVNRSSLNNICQKWSPELKRYASSAPIILVGLKKDLRDSATSTAGQFVFSGEARKVARDISAVKYMECSARSKEGMHDVFNEAIRAVLTPTRVSLAGLAGCEGCSLL